MAKLTGPLFSLDARGSIAKALVYSYWRGVNYVRRRVVPNNPQSVDQTAVRDLITDSSQAWMNSDSPIDTAYKAAYDTYAEGQAYSGFNAYISDCVAKNGGKDYDGSLDIPTEPGDRTA